MNEWHDAEKRVEKAQEFFEQRRWHEALEELRAAIFINPYNSAWFFNIGLTLDELERYDDAIEAYREAIEIEPGDVQALNHLGVDLHRTGRYEEALRIFESIERIDSSYEPSYCHRILTYTELGNHEKAEEMFYLSRMVVEECPQCYHNIAQSLFDRRLYDKAIYCWQRAMDLNESLPQIHVRVAEALRAKGELEKARQHYLVGLRKEPRDTHVLLDLGELLMEMGRVQEAGEKFRRAIELAPENPSGHYCHALWLRETDEPARAASALVQVLKLDPTYPAAHLNLAEIYQATDAALARRHFRQEMLLRPQSPELLLRLANRLIDMRMHHAALICLKRLTHIEPTHAQGWQNLAVVQFLRHRYGDGIDSSREALRHDPTNAMVMYNLALAFECLRDFDQATLWVRRALQESPKDISLERLETRLRLRRTFARICGWARRLWPRSGRAPRATND